MRICVDIQSAVSQRAGVGRYTRQLVEHLGSSKSPGDDLNLFYFDFHRRGLDFSCPGATPHPVRWIPGTLVQQAWKRFRTPPFNWFAGKADLYHFPNFIIPPLSSGKSVVTIHDMSFVRYPQFAESKNLAYLTAAIHDTSRRADAIITVSRFSKKEIEETLGIAPDRVFAIPLGISPGFTRPPADEITTLRRRLKLERPYLLTVGTLEPRKNIPFMIDVFEKLDYFDGDLILAGMPGWQVDPILARIQNSPRRDRIRHLDFIPDGQLSALYAGAELFLITSFYEGFGFPPLEAMACGTPVVSSGGGSLAEMLGISAVTIPGFEAEEWTSTIHALLEDKTRRTQLGAQGPAHAATFSWSTTAQKTWEVYRQVTS